MHFSQQVLKQLFAKEFGVDAENIDDAVAKIDTKSKWTQENRDRLIKKMCDINDFSPALRKNLEAHWQKSASQGR